jgi:hypothetical protein
VRTYSPTAHPFVGGVHVGTVAGIIIEAPDGLIIFG